ncbi:hypothetical protein BD779DRAFT_1520784 [Infundibulicybe gibba]|nr:hypothetical protein BD779DRAFT_1520784 [Infundibulicybe gibba]
MLAVVPPHSHSAAIAVDAGNSSSSSSTTPSNTKPADVQGLFLRHPYPYQHQIIELVEEPRPISAVVHDSAASCSSAPSSGGSYYSSSAPSSSYASDEDEDEEEEIYEDSVCESAGPSYCSSDEDDDGMCVDLDPRGHGLSVSRILKWREGFTSNISATLSGMFPPVFDERRRADGETESALMHHEPESEPEYEAGADAPLMRKRKAASDLGARTHPISYPAHLPSSSPYPDSDSVRFFSLSCVYRVC